MDARSLVTRMTICKMRDHAWLHVSYPSSSEEGGSGRFLRCQPCGKEHHEDSAVTRVPFL
jgi:hypothetical protein